MPALVNARGVICPRGLLLAVLLIPVVLFLAVLLILAVLLPRCYFSAVGARAATVTSCGNPLPARENQQFTPACMGVHRPV